MTCNTMFLEKPTIAFSGESRCMTHLWVSVNVEPREELRHSYPSQSITVESLYHQEVSRKIRAALKILTVRKEHVIVQFWSPRVAGKDQLLTTIDQPFGLGVVSDELCSYRRDSEHKAFIVDKDHEEGDASPPARVFMRGLPEWTSNLTNYKTKDFPQQDCAIRCNLHGYLALPVSDPTTGLRVGVLELLMSSKLEDFAYEVEYIHAALKTWNLTSTQAFEVFDGPGLNVSNERSSVYELDKIFNILKRVCDTHRLPVAQTWTVSPPTSNFVRENVFEKSCNSFNTRCLGKVCMSSTLVPYYARDVNKWSFVKASKKRHLEKSRGVAGRALSSRGSCYCQDVTELSEEEYPLVHNARMSKLTGCLATFLHSVEGNNDYVLEFFLHIKDSIHVRNLFNTLKQSIEDTSGFELGDGSSVEVIGPPMDLSLNKTDSSDLESVASMGDNFSVEKSDFLKEDRKRKRDSDTVLSSSTNTVMVNVTFNDSILQFAFPLFRGLTKLKKKVAKRFMLEGQGLQLKYIDEDDDLILVCDNEAMRFALDASHSSNSMNLICSKITL